MKLNNFSLLIVNWYKLNNDSIKIFIKAKFHIMYEMEKRVYR
jgi:hypothetical protein